MFKLHSDYKPTGDQPQAIEYLSKGIEEGKKYSRLIIAKAMKDKGMDTNTIMELTGLNEEEIKKL